MHCNLRPSDLAPVVLATMHQPTKFQHNGAMNDSVIAIQHFPPVFRGLPVSPFSELGGSNCTKFAENRTIIDAQQYVVDVRSVAPFRNEAT